MYMFDMNRQYTRPIVALTVVPIVPPIEIKHVHSCVSYQRVTYQKYNRRGHESPSGYGALGCRLKELSYDAFDISNTNSVTCFTT